MSCVDFQSMKFFPNHFLKFPLPYILFLSRRPLLFPAGLDYFLVVAMLIVVVVGIIIMRKMMAAATMMLSTTTTMTVVSFFVFHSTFLGHLL